MTRWTHWRWLARWGDTNSNPFQEFLEESRCAGPKDMATMASSCLKANFSTRSPNMTAVMSKFMILLLNGIRSVSSIIRALSGSTQATPLRFPVD